MIKMHGVKLPNLKQTAGCAPERIPTPSKVTIPMSMHIGIPAVPVVKPGDTVKVGQLIGEAGGFVSAPVYASISGTVASVDNFMKFAGNYVKSITIASDGRNEPLETLTPPDVHDLESFLHAVNDSGVVGQGGAGFPSAVKLVVKDLDKIEAIIINGAECEPYVTSDTRTMLDRTDEVWEGILMLQEYYRAKRIIIAIEENKPECIQRFRALCENTQGIEVAALPHMYPQGGEKILVYNLLGHIIPEGKLPIDVGAVVMRDRKRLAEDGMVVIVVTLSSWDNAMLSDPEILTRGFVYVKESEDMLEELKRVTKETVLACEESGVKDWSAIKSRIKSNVSSYLYKTTKRSPMILPILMDI